MRHLHSPDPYYEAKRAATAATRAQIQAQPGRVVLLYQVEMTYTRQPSRATAYEAADHRQPLAERSYRTNIQPRSTASFDALTGQVVYLQRTRITIRGRQRCAVSRCGA